MNELELIAVMLDDLNRRIVCFDQRRTEDTFVALHARLMALIETARPVPVSHAGGNESDEALEGPGK